MIWMHLVKLTNLSERVDEETARQMRQSIDRIIAILTGQHRQEEEPESARMLQRVAAILKDPAGQAIEA
jgi:hypothetical protein